MGKHFLKQAALVIAALVLSLSFVPKVSAADSFGAAITKTGGQPVATDEESQDDGKTYCDPGAANMFAKLCDNVESQPLTSEPENTGSGVSTITMHVKEGEGYFEGEANPLEHSKEFYFRDGFDDYTQPVSSRDNYVFAGWSTSEEATTVDIEVGFTKAGQIDGDLYAVWSDKAYVYYHMINSYWEEPTYGDIYQYVIMEYDAGSTFTNLAPAPTPNESIYDFMGWYERMGGKGEQYINGTTVLNTLITDVYTAWNYNADRMDDEMFLNEVEDVTVGVSIPVYKFTAPETAMYEIYTDGIVSGDTDEDSHQGMIRIEDIYDRTLAMEDQMDHDEGWGDVHTYYEMQAGETYYIRFLEAKGHYLRFNASIRKPQMVDVTFHANVDGGYFDDDLTKTTKTLSLPTGKEIKLLAVEGLTYDTNEMTFGSWQFEEPDGKSYLVVPDEPVDLYASYVDMISVFLDYKGGYDPINKTSTSMVAKFIPGRAFETPIDPSIDDPHLGFAGWSRDPNATVPDEDILEGQIDAGIFKNQTLYAVYTDRAPVTFVTEYGAYMVDDPNTTVFETSNAIGHIFYGMSVMHRDLNVVHTGWIDQNGERTYATDDIDPRYKIEGDTTFTAVLEYRLIAHANGGVFPNGGIGGAEQLIVQLPYIGEDTMFSHDAVLDRTGMPLNYNSSKYFTGFAYRDDATEPDIDDETRVAYLGGEFFAVWADDEYYVAEGENTTWTKGTADGARFVVKRKGNDDLTYQAFNGISIDGEEVDENNFTDERGSLILTLNSDYLETLDTGEHELTIHFLDSDAWTGEEFPTDVMTTFAIANEEDEEDEPVVPDTATDDDASDAAAPDTGGNTATKAERVATSTGISLIVMALGLSLICYYRRTTK